MARTSLERRTHWVDELAKLSNSFTNDSTKVLSEIRKEIVSEGNNALVEHLRLCGAIPEVYGHDSSAEKLYSKYTDTLLSESFGAMGLKSAVIEARADHADVQAVSEGDAELTEAHSNAYSLVADAKAFRLSRTAKNQKDFKIQAMDGWRNGLDFAVVVAPIYQLPGRTSQIYQQAISRNVCILSYSHISTLVRLAFAGNHAAAKHCLHSILLSLAPLHPSKSAEVYWRAINTSLVSGIGKTSNLWLEEKNASEASLALLKKESLKFLNLERDRMLRLSHEDALAELVKMAGISKRIEQVASVSHGSLLGL